MCNSAEATPPDDSRRDPWGCRLAQQLAGAIEAIELASDAAARRRAIESSKFLSSLLLKLSRREGMVAEELADAQATWGRVLGDFMPEDLARALRRERVAGASP